MAETAMRYMVMLSKLPRFPNGISTQELLAELVEEGYPTSLRTIQRDLEKLSAHFPLVVDDSYRPYRWSYKSHATSQTFPRLDLPTAITLSLAEVYLKPVLPARLLRNIAPQLKEAHETIARSGSELTTWPDKIRVLHRGLGIGRPQISDDIAEQIAEALLRDLQCEIYYQGRGRDEPELLTVHPLAWIFRDPNTYLIATVEGREGPRQLLFHRMLNAKVMERPRECPTDFNIDHYINDSHMHILNSKKTINLHLRCDRQSMMHLLETPISNDQRIINENAQTFELLASVYDSLDLQWWLKAHSNDIEILSPTWLRDRLIKLLESALVRHAATP